jgi:hypothetical protein
LKRSGVQKTGGLEERLLYREAGCDTRVNFLKS